MARKREDDPLLNLHFEYLMSRLFGDSRFRGSAVYQWPSAWRDDLPRIFDALQEAVHVNVGGDNTHRAELERECQGAIGDLKRRKSDHQITLAAVYRLTRISFTRSIRPPGKAHSATSKANHGTRACAF